MSANQAVFPIATMARVLGVSTAGYYAWRSRLPSARATADGELLKQARTIHAVSRGTYGAPRVHAELRAEGRAVGKKRIARLDRKSTRLNSSHEWISYAVFCLKKKRRTRCSSRLWTPEHRFHGGDGPRARR